MALLKFEPRKELAPLRVKIGREVRERVERYREFCGALELADLVERALIYVMDKDADFRARESGVAEAGAKGFVNKPFDREQILQALDAAGARVA